MLCCGVRAAKAASRKSAADRESAQAKRSDASDFGDGGTSYADDARQQSDGADTGDDECKSLRAICLEGSGLARREVQAAISTLEKDDLYSLKVRRAAAKYQSDGYYGDAIYCFALALSAEQEPAAQADLLNSIGTAYRKTGKYANALSSYDRSLRTLRVGDGTLRKAADAERGAQPEVAKVMINRGLTLKEMGLVEAALQHFEEALELQRKFYGDESSGCETARTLCHIGKAQSKLNRHDAALISYETALAVLRRTVGPEADHPDIAVALGKMGNLYAATGQYEDALKFHKMTLSMKSRLRVEPNEMASSLMDTGNVYYMMGRFRRALRYHFRSLKLKGAHRCRDLRALAASLGNIGYAYEGLGKCKVAQKYFEKTLTLLMEFHDNPRHPDIIRTESNVARVKDVLQYSGAIRMCGDALLY